MAVLFASVLFDPWMLIYVFAALPVPAIVYAVLFVAYEVWADRRGGDRVNHSATPVGRRLRSAVHAAVDPALLGRFLRLLRILASASGRPQPWRISKPGFSLSCRRARARRTSCGRRRRPPPPAAGRLAAHELQFPAEMLEAGQRVALGIVEFTLQDARQLLLDLASLDLAHRHLCIPYSWVSP
jgi:hypothetical protein